MGTSIWDIFDECMDNVYTKEISTFDKEENYFYDFDKFLKNISNHVRSDVAQMLCIAILRELANKEEIDFLSIVKETLERETDENICIIKNHFYGFQICGDIPRNSKLILSNQEDLEREKDATNL